jgi:hypothetical protein
MLKSNIEINSVEEAHEANLQYQRVDTQSFRQQPFNRAYRKYHNGSDVLNQYNRSYNKRNKSGNSVSNVAITNNSEVIKKTKDSVLQDFKDLNRDDLLKELDATKSIPDNIDNDDNEEGFQE